MLVDYRSAFRQAVERSQRFGLDVPTITRIHNTLLIPVARQQIQTFMDDAIAGIIDLELRQNRLFGQCMRTHWVFLDFFRSLFGSAYFTVGGLETLTGSIYTVDDRVIRDCIVHGIARPNVNLHAWITLPSMEIIDLTLIATIAIAQGVHQEHFDHVNINMGFAHEVLPFIYHPMIVGTDFLHKTGAVNDGTFWTDTVVERSRASAEIA